MAQLKEAEREIASLKAKNLLSSVEPILRGAKDVAGVSVISHRADGIGAGDLRSLALELRNRLTDRPAVITVVGGTADKPAVVVATTEGARHRGLRAGELVRVASEALGGRGGGKDDLAQGGGSNAEPEPAALQAVERRPSARRPPKSADPSHVQRHAAETAEDRDGSAMRAGVRLGLDWGEARIGVAACDPAGTLAYPVATVPAGPAAEQALLALVEEYQPMEIVVGLPRSLSGGEGPAAVRIRSAATALVVDLLRPARRPVPVRLVDERLTTVTRRAAAAARRVGGPNSNAQ